MKYLYRIHEGFGRGTSVDGYNGIKCLHNFIGAIGDKTDLTIFVDNSSPDFVSEIKSIHDNIVETALGNSKSFLNCVEYAIQNFDESERVYFVENDYLHLSDVENYLNDGFSVGASFVTLYDHPDKYNISQYPTLQSKIFVGEHSHWRSVPSTCMTFATHVASLIKNKDILYESCCHEVPSDWYMFEKMQSRGELLVSCMPGRCTHLERDYLTPLVDWKNVG